MTSVELRIQPHDALSKVNRIIVVNKRLTFVADPPFAVAVEDAGDGFQKLSDMEPPEFSSRLHAAVTDHKLPLVDGNGGIVTDAVVVATSYRWGCQQRQISYLSIQNRYDLRLISSRTLAGSDLQNPPGYF